MPYGYNGRILCVDLTQRTIEVDEPGEGFFRKYLGGSALGTYYCLRDIRAGADPLGPANVLALAGSVITGAPAPCLSRFSVNAKSPLTGGIGDAQAGGWWAPELKFAGFEAVVIRGRADEPVYLWINNGRAEIRSARHLWGKTTGEAEQAIRDELGDPCIRVACIGPGGENLVRFACIINERKHAAGRTGMGAVMGSKNLKAIAVRGDKHTIKWYDRGKLAEISKLAPSLIAQNPNMLGLKEYGTDFGLAAQQATGGLPTRNFRSGVFEGYENLTAQRMKETIFVRHERCYGCPVACKRVVAAQEPYVVDEAYGGPEYETVAALGSYLGIDDLVTVAKGNELCNKYGLDTISTGASIAFAMECFENGLLTRSDTDGIELRFGNAAALVPMIEKIARREGIGELLANGPALAAQELGGKALSFAMHVKGNPLPAHMPRVKRGLALVYAVNPFGADHVSSDQDPAFAPDAPEFIQERMNSYGLYEWDDTTSLGSRKVRMIYYTQQYFSLLDSLTACVYGYGTAFLYDMTHLTQIVGAATGWNVTTWELLKAGERRTNMMRVFNEREGFSAEDDTLPRRLFEPLPEGPSKGLAVNELEFEQAKKLYYKMAGWDPVTGNPTVEKLKELGLDWLVPANG